MASSSTRPISTPISPVLAGSTLSMTAPSLAEKLEVTYGLSKAKTHPTTSAIAIRALAVIDVLGKVKGDQKLHAEVIARAVGAIHNAVSTWPLEDYLKTEPMSPVVFDIDKFDLALTTMHGILIEHCRNGGRSKVNLGKELKRLNEALSDFDAHQRKIVEPIKSRDAATRRGSYATLTPARESSVLFHRTDVDFIDSTRWQKDGSFWELTYHVQVKGNPDPLILKQYPGAQEQFMEHRRVLGLAWYGDWRLPQVRGTSSDEAHVPFILFHPIHGVPFTSHIEYLYAEVEPDALEITKRLLKEAQDMAQKLHRDQKDDDVRVDTNTIRDAIFDPEKNHLIIPPIVSWLGRGNPLITDEDVDALARQMVEEASKSPAIARIRENSPRPPQVEQALAKIERNPNMTSYDAKKWIDFLDLALRSRHVDPRSALYGNALRKLREIGRKAGQLPSSCHLADDSIKLDNERSVSESAISDIYRGKIGKRKVAVKVLRMHMDNREKVEKDFLNEVILWKYLVHPNILPFLGVSRIKKLSLVSEWMDNGSIINHLQKVPTVDRLKFIIDIVEGLAYLHGLEIIHGDMKGANVFVSNDLHACLADFGLATAAYSTGATTTQGTFKGTRRWMAPELFSDADGGRPTYQADIYALGMVMWEVFTLEHPFPDITNDNMILTVVTRGERPQPPKGVELVGFSKDVWRVMESCWRHESAKRPAVQDLLTSLRPADSLQSAESQ